MSPKTIKIIRRVKIFFKSAVFTTPFSILEWIAYGIATPDKNINNGNIRS